jgi:hypothetical protein
MLTCRKVRNVGKGERTMTFTILRDKFKRWPETSDSTAGL